MCDFHSIICYVDGAIFHAPENSHTDAVKLSGRPENDGPRRFVEAEWDGRGEYPGAEKITRGVANEKQIRAIDAHFRGLVEVLQTGNFEGKWSEPEYVDVRREFAARCPAERLVELEDRLLSDSDWSVRYQFTLRCPESRFPEFAERLLADSNFFVRAACARRLQAAAV